MQDKDEEYKKSYNGFVIWMVIFVGAMSILPLFPDIVESEKMTAIIFGNVLSLSMVILTFIIYINEKIYWYTGISYEAAKECDKEVRKEYAFRHLKRFGIFAGIYLIYSIVSVIMDFPFVADIYYMFLGIVITAISTVGIKLENSRVKGKSRGIR